MPSRTKMVLSIVENAGVVMAVCYIVQRLFAHRTTFACQIDWFLGAGQRQADLGITMYFPAMAHARLARVTRIYPLFALFVLAIYVGASIPAFY